MFSASHRQISTVKDLQLGPMTKRKTGSREMMTYLNRQATSYNEVDRFETSMAEAKLRLQCLHGFLPNLVVISIFVTFVFDNCDPNPGLRSASMHCTNGIRIQKQDHQICDINWFNVHESVLTGHSQHTSFKPVLRQCLSVTS